MNYIGDVGTDEVRHSIRQLSAAVLRRAFRDATGDVRWVTPAHGKGYGKKTEQWFIDDARRWILKSKVYEMWCDILNLHPDEMRRRIRDL